MYKSVRKVSFQSTLGIYGQRTLTYSVRGSITVWLTSCLTGLDLDKQENLLLIKHKQSRWIPSLPMCTLLSMLSQCDQIARLFFNIWPLTPMKICPKAIKFAEAGSIISPVRNEGFKKWPKTFKFWPKWRIFDKSGHTPNPWTTYLPNLKKWIIS